MNVPRSRQDRASVCGQPVTLYGHFCVDMGTVILVWDTAIFVWKR